MLSVSNLDQHPARKTHKLTRAGVWHHGDAELLCAVRHGTSVLECEGAAATIERSGNLLHSDVTSNPRSSRIRAVSISHGLGMMKEPSFHEAAKIATLLRSNAAPVRCSAIGISLRWLSPRASKIRRRPRVKKKIKHRSEQQAVHYQLK